MNQRACGIDGTSALKLVQTRELWLIGATEATHTRSRARNRTAQAIDEKTGLHKSFTIAACALIVAIALLGVAVSGLTSWRVSNAIEDRGVEVVLVQPGDTLWSIATRRSVDGCSTSELVRWIREQNELKSARILAGQRITAPAMRAHD
jgi:nucleoid-associated protein YgaU